MADYDEKSIVNGDKINEKTPDEKIKDTLLDQIYESKKQALKKLAGDDNTDSEDPQGWEHLCKLYPFRFEDVANGLSYLATAQLDDRNYDNWYGAGTPRWINAVEVKRAVVGYLAKKSYAVTTDDDTISALIFGSSTNSVQIKDHQIIGFKFSAKRDDGKIFIYAIGRPNL